MSDTPVVSREVAEKEIERFLEAMDLTADSEDVDTEELTERSHQINIIAKSIMRGHLEIDDKGQPVYRPFAPGTDTSPIVFFEPTGAGFMGTPGKNAKSVSDIERFFGMLAEATRQPVVRFTRMKKRDLRVVMALGVLFFK